MDNNKINEAALTKRLKTLVLQERYKDAQKELEDIDIQRLKNSSVLCLVGEVYMGLGEYNEAERVLLRVYDKNPTARRILDLLTTLYIEKGEYSEAEYYYKEFISVASKDLHRYILRYRIDKGKNERTSVLIHTLEKLKEYEYIEEWAYELARLYAESGQTKKCLHECDEIVLWFGHGEYVDKAIALRCKLTGEPLPEMTTVEKYEAEEERRAQEEKEQEKVYEEISRRSANPVVDGMENEFDGSIDTEMIQQTLEGRQNKAEGENTPTPTPPAPEQEVSPEDKTADGDKTDEPAEMSAGDAETAESVQQEDNSEDWLKAEDAVNADEEDDEIVPENALASSENEKGEKESITQIFGNLMSGKLFGKLIPGKKEEEEPAPAEEEKPAEASDAVPAEEEKPAEASDTVPAEEEGETPAEAEGESPAEESTFTEPEEKSGEEETAAEEEPEELSAEEEAESDDEQNDDEILEGSPDLSIFEMKADQAFEDSIIESMDASFRASFGEDPVAEAEASDAIAEEATEIIEEPEEETSEITEKPAEEASEMTAESAEELTEAADVSEETSEAVQEAGEDISDTAEEPEETAEQQAVSFAEEITEAVGEPSAFISEQTEDFIPEEEDRIVPEAEPAEEAEAETETEPAEEAEAETEAEPAEEAEAETDAEPAEEAEAETEAEPEEAEAETETEPAEEAEAETEAEPAEEAEAELETEPVEETEAEPEEPAEEAEAESEEPAEEESEPEAEDDEIIENEDDDDEDEIIDEDDDEDEIISENGDDDFVKSLFAAAVTAPAAEEAAATASVEEEPEEAAEETEEAEDEFSDSLQASDTVMDIFGAVAEVKSIKQQLTETFTKFEFQDSVDLLAPYDINFVVTGEDMSVKSQIAIGIAKALNTYQICDKNKLVRASAEDLNGRDFSSIFQRLKGGCLIIESADKLNENAVKIISDYIQQENQDVAIVLAGEEKPLMEMLSHNRLLRQRFLNIIHIGKYNESELVQLATGYAKKKGYEVSRDAAPVLKKLFRERMDKGESVNYEDIIVIVENAISSLERRNMENLFMTVLDNKYEEAAMFLLQPQDFLPQEEEPEEP